MSSPEDKVKTIFGEALRLGKDAERRAYLDGACAGDPAVRREVESLLAAHGRAGDFLDATRPVEDSDFVIEPHGMMIGRYKLLEKIGEGGFGVVYMAEQVEPLQRKVALKIIKPGMDTRQVVARFEAERQALALMEHPNIAKALDAGATDAGRPYFVMELVRGIPITDYCDQRALSTLERLRLFIQVCHAVQHAHQRGIIHRDLKPSNVLVTLLDGEPVPKIIDFGVAKALGPKLTEKTFFTGFTQMVGTPAYMSPEQAELSGLDVDTRSDIYSLGVLLYELLTGVTPFDKETLARAALDEIRRLIREQEPPKPSTRLHTLGERLSEVARHRHTEPANLSRLVRGDLDWIVMKCLEKDRTRRYETPSALGRDVEAYLNHQPVLATPPGAAYLLLKYCRRHRAGVTLALALGLTLLLGAGVSFWQAVRASKQARIAETRRVEAEGSRRAAADAQVRAERSAREVARQLSREFVDKGTARLDQGDYFDALVWYSEALRLDKGDAMAETFHRLRIGTLLQQSPKVRQLFEFVPAANTISVEFSPEGARLLTAGGVNSAQVWDLAAAKPACPPLHHGQVVIDARFSPEGSRVVTASFDGTARVWDSRTGAPLTPPMIHQSNVWSAVFSPDGRRVVTASEDTTARVWDAATGQPVTPPLGHSGPVWPAVFSPDGRLVATASQDRTARVWDAATGQPVTPPLQHGGKVWWIAFSPNCKLVATASEDHTARIWDARSGQPVTVALKHAEEVTCVAFSPDGRHLATGSGESIARFFDFQDRPGEARVWDVATGKPITPPLSHRLSVFYIAFSPDGTCLATASYDHTARVWDANTGKPITPPLVHRDFVIRVAFSPDSRRLATASAERVVRIWEIPREPPKLTELQQSVLAGRFKFSPDHRLIAGVYMGSGAGVWDAATGKPIARLLHDTNLHHFVFSPDSRLLATAGADHAARIWDTSTGLAACAALTHDAPVLCAAFSEDSQRVITGSADGTARVWNAQTGAALTAPLRHSTNVLCAAFSPDGHFVATGCEDKAVRLWDSRTGAAAAAPMLHNDGVSLVVFSPNGTRLATATFSGRVQVWEMASCRPLTPPLKHGGRMIMSAGVEQITFSPDSERIVVSDSDGTARIWSCRTGMPLTPPLKHQKTVFSTCFSHDGRMVVTAGWDQTARVWDAATGQPLTPPLLLPGDVDAAVFTADDRQVNTVGNFENGGFVQTFDLTPENRPAADLMQIARVLSGNRVDASGTLVPLEPEIVTNAGWIIQY